MINIRDIFSPVMFVAVVHITLGVIIFYIPDAINITALAALKSIHFPLLGGKLTTNEISGGLIIIGLAAFAGKLFFLTQTLQIILVAPQQLLLSVQFFGIIMAIRNGVYPDGYIPAKTYQGSVGFILADQCPILGMCLAHTVHVMFIHVFNLKEYYENKLLECKRELADLYRTISMYQDSKFWVELSRQKDLDISVDFEHKV